MSYRKGSLSKTHPGDYDFTTKKGDKVFHRMNHYVRKSRKPYMKGGSGSRQNGGRRRTRKHGKGRRTRRKR